jgi:signal transduction histidine kinase
VARHRWILLLALAAAAAAGAATEAVPGAGAARTAGDLVTGWALLCCGAWGLAVRPRQARWALLSASGLAWFAANLATGTLAYAHRGPLVHAAAAAMPRSSGRRIGSVLVAAAIAAGYADAAVVGAGHGEVDVVVAVLLGALALRAGSRLAGALVALGAALGIAASTALADMSASYASAALYVYEAALCTGALLLAATASGNGRGSITDLVVELGPQRRSPRTRDALARALGDPTLEIAYWLPGQQVYVDLEGRPVALPAARDGRATTVVEHDGERIAALVHDASLLDDPQLVVAVREAAGLMLANDRLQAAAGARLVELRASRRRMVTARDAQRRRLARRLSEGPAQRLAGVAATVHAARGGGPPTPEQAELLDLIDGELEQARTELDELARGIHPRALTERGLAAALAGLAERAPFAVNVSAPAKRLPEPVEAAVYFVCAEALTNAAKHSGATTARCDVNVDRGRVRVEIADDGAGGADPARGSGLHGLADRVEAAGGTLVVRSPAGEGTTIQAELPCAQ